MTPAIDVAPKDLKTLNALLKAHLPGIAVWAYGSRVKWTSRPDSDLDIVVFAQVERRADVAAMRTACEESNLPFLVDLFVWDEVPEKFRENIEAEHVVLQEGGGKLCNPDSGLLGSLPEGWHYTTLGEACQRSGGDIQTGPFGSQLHASDYVSDGIPSIMPQNIGDNRIVEDGIARISETDAQRLSRYRVRTGDIVYSRRGDVERRALVRNAEDGWLCGTGCLRVRFGNADVDSRFASFYLGHPSVRSWIVRHAHGATMANLNTSILSACPLAVPPPPEQRAIAGVLGAMDDKIEQNRKTAQTLEKLAQAIFRAWFVDFEPVKWKIQMQRQGAKAQGRKGRPIKQSSASSRPGDLAFIPPGATSFPGMPQEVFNALPTRFVDSEIGPVPEGWEVRAIGDVVTTKGGGTPSTGNPEFWDGGVHCWATPKDMSRLSHPVLLDTERRITDAGVSAINSEVLPVGTVLMSSRAPVGYLAIAGVPTAINQGFIAMICDGPLPPVYVLNWAFTSMETIKAHASGTTFPEISKKTFRPLPIVHPTDDVTAAYRQVADPLFDLLIACVRENEKHAEMRDYLLPRLLSGAVRVEVADV